MVIDDREYLTPPDNEAEKVLKCYLCKDWIYEGDEYYFINGLEYCKDCVEEKIAEPYDMEGLIVDLKYHQGN